MTRAEAGQVKPGDPVRYRGRRYTVEAVAERGLWAPRFRLPDIGEVSYALCGLGRLAPPPPAADPGEAGAWSSSSDSSSCS
jgi:hypothetical protein